MDTTNNINFKRTDSENPDFVRLIKELDENLTERNGDLQMFFNQFNKVDMIRQVIVAYVDGNPAGCGAIKNYQMPVAEVKRMFVRPNYRGKGVASQILIELEKWAVELGYIHMILETSKVQREAVNLYQKKGYAITENYDPYIGVDNSICFKKLLEID